MKNFLCIVLLSLSISLPAVAESETIKLGYLTDLSGKGAPLGTKSRLGAELAIQDLAAQGIKVEIIFGDHRTEGKQAMSEALRLFDAEQVDGLLCDLTQPCIPVSDIALRRKRLFFYQSPAESILLNNQYAFRNFLDYQDGCQAIANEWKKAGKTNVGGIFLIGEFSELCKQGLLSVYPNALVDDIAEDEEATRSLMMKFKAKKIEASILTGFEKHFISVFRLHRELKMNIEFGVSGALLTNLVIEGIKEDSNFIWSFNFPDMLPPFKQRVLKLVTDANDSNIESSAIAYAAVFQEVLALRSCAKEDLECQIKKIQEYKDSPLPVISWAGRKAKYMQKVMRGTQTR